MKKFLCKWRMRDSTEWVTYYVRCYSKSVAMDTLIRKAQQNHMIEISEPVEV